MQVRVGRANGEKPGSSQPCEHSHEHCLPVPERASQHTHEAEQRHQMGHGARGSYYEHAGSEGSRWLGGARGIVLANLEESAHCRKSSAANGGSGG